VTKCGHTTQFNLFPVTRNPFSDRVKAILSDPL
jgi:hypothetical protein